MAQKFPDKTPTEAKVCTFDFTNEKSTGTTLSAPVVSKTLITGDDTGAATLTVGTPSLDGNLVTVLIGGGTDLNTYRLTAKVDADNGEVHEIAGDMKVKVSAA